MSRALIEASFVFGARITGAIIGLVSVPIYMRMLGQENFGIVSFSLTIQNLASLLDLGLAPTVSREIAKQQNKIRKSEVISTFEVVYWTLAVALLCLSIVLANLASNHWLQVVPGQERDVATALSIALAAISIRWPVAFYTGTLQGLGYTVNAQLLSTVFVIIKTFGGLFVIVANPGSILSLFAWNLLVAIAEILSFKKCSQKKVQDEVKKESRFKLSVLRDLWRPAVGLGAIAAFGTITSNTDRILLGRYLTLGEFGRYASFAALAGGFAIGAGAVCSVYFSRMAKVSASPNGLRTSVHIRSALNMILWPTIPVFAFLLVFSNEIAFIWLGENHSLGDKYHIFKILILAGWVNALANPFYTAALAGGRKKILFVINLASASILIPLYILAIPSFGAIAAASGALLQNCFVLIVLAYTYYKSFAHFKWVFRWLLVFLSTALLLILIKIHLPGPPANVSVLLAAAGVVLLAAALSAYNTAEVRNLIRRIKTLAKVVRSA